MTDLHTIARRSGKIAGLTGEPLALGLDYLKDEGLPDEVLETYTEAWRKARARYDAGFRMAGDELTRKG